MNTFNAFNEYIQAYIFQCMQDCITSYIALQALETGAKWISIRAHALGE